MKTLDFSLLLRPISTTTNLKDVALVEGVYSISEQIKNCVFFTPFDLPFSSTNGVDTSAYNLTNNFDRMRYVIKLSDVIKASNKKIHNLSIKHSIQNNNLKLEFTFDYGIDVNRISKQTIKLEKPLL